MSFVGEWAYPLFKTESDYLKGFWKFQYFYPMTRRFNFSLTSRIGVGRGKIPIPERFFSGGSNSYRGERFDELGPKDPVSGMPIGGKAMFLINLEIKFPLIPSFDDLSGALFYDFGQGLLAEEGLQPLQFPGRRGIRTTLQDAPRPGPFRPGMEHRRSFEKRHAVAVHHDREHVLGAEEA